jgi:hypothetical protein
VTTNPVKDAHERSKLRILGLSQGSIETWRATIPWTDDQISAALDAEAEETERANDTRGGGSWLSDKLRRAAAHLRSTHRLSSWMLRYAVPRLVKSCGICGKTALYRYGSAGRCREHRKVVPERVELNRARIWRAHDEIHAADVLFHKSADAARSHHKAVGRKSKPRK